MEEVYELSPEELKNADMYWITYVQKLHYLIQIESIEKQKKVPRDSKILKLNPILVNVMMRLNRHLPVVEFGNII